METIRKKEGFESQKLFVQPDYMLEELTTNELTQNLYVSDIGCFPKAHYHYRERMDGCDSHILIYCSNGEGWVEWERDKPVKITERQLAVIPAGVPHRYGASADHPWTIYWLHLKGDHASQLLQAYGLNTHVLHLPLGMHTRWLEDFEHCFTLLTTKTYSMPAQIHVSHTVQHLLSSIGLSEGGTTQDKKRDGYMEKAIRFMSGHVGSTLTLTQLSEHTGLSKQHLIYLFKREAGCPPIEYYLRVKMQHASQLLDLTDLSIKEIGMTVGIADPYYFSRLFKKIIGCSPTHYRTTPKG
jgi:AraC-like DNA-binding protein/quercetin dioxygenase-like cupin family protein